MTELLQSIAGLLAATVCSTHFESVLVIEPDPPANDERGIELPANIECRPGVHGAPVPVSPRKRIMQWYTPHTYHPVSYMALQKLFPELQTELDYFGFKPIKLYPRSASQGAHKTALVDDPPQTLSLSRPAYETLLRRLVKKSQPNVSFMTATAVAIRGAEARGFSKVDNVTIQLEGGATEEINAELVVGEVLILDSFVTHEWTVTPQAF
ncbi:hypothetical protein FRB96_008005 [Tulasnella sp. 330]|nr:hypothetical protein FRB96_008005 [Tulasnella sp. 330]